MYSSLNLLEKHAIIFGKDGIIHMVTGLTQYQVNHLVRSTINQIDEQGAYTLQGHSHKQHPLLSRCSIVYTQPTVCLPKDHAPCSTLLITCGGALPRIVS